MDLGSELIRSDKQVQKTLRFWPCEGATLESSRPVGEALDTKYVSIKLEPQTQEWQHLCASASARWTLLPRAQSV
jgi:hypothetical protein